MRNFVKSEDEVRWWGNLKGGWLEEIDEDSLVEEVRDTNIPLDLDGAKFGVMGARG